MFVLYIYIYLNGICEDIHLIYALPDLWLYCLPHIQFRFI